MQASCSFSKTLLVPLCLLALAGTAAKAAEPKMKSGDQRLLKLIDRQTQLADLLSSGKLAYDAGDFTTAVARWTLLLKLDAVPADVDRAIRPLLADARTKAAGQKGDDLAPPGEQQPGEQKPDKPPRPVNLVVTGSVSGGGAAGPGGAVISLHRVDGPTPRPVPVTKALFQRDKAFVPHVVAVTVGSEVDFKNEDDLFHNVFSLSPSANFDTGLHKQGAATPVKFDKPGIVELFCNIHASMLGFLVVVDTPWYAVADGSGAFQIKNVPPGQYDLEAWHEKAATPTKKRVTIGEESTQLAISVGADKRVNQFPPDKYGKPRQQQLGY